MKKILALLLALVLVLSLVACGAKKEETKTEPTVKVTDNADEIAEMFARMELIELMYKARHEAGLTQKEIAEKLGTKQAYISALEKGRKNITYSTLIRYARACGKRIAITLL